MNETHKVAIVTGGARGIGRAIVERLMRDGMRVVLADLDEKAARAAAEALTELGEVDPVGADVADEADAARIIETARTRFGRLDALVNNAGIGIGKPIENLTLQDWNRVLGVNLTGAFLCARAAAPLMRESGGGAIVNIASSRAVQSEPDTEAYAASKGGLVALTHALAISLGPAVRVNVVSPGWIDTREAGQTGTGDLSPSDHAQHPCGRVGRPSDIAGLVAWLLGPEAGFVTGAHFLADGGMTRKMIYEP